MFIWGKLWVSIGNLYFFSDKHDIRFPLLVFSLLFVKCPEANLSLILQTITIWELLAGSTSVSPAWVSSIQVTPYVNYVECWSLQLDHCRLPTNPFSAFQVILTSSSLYPVTIELIEFSFSDFTAEWCFFLIILFLLALFPFV